MISKKGNSLEILFLYDNFLFRLENLTRYDVDSFSVETTTYWPFKNNLFLNFQDRENSYVFKTVQLYGDLQKVIIFTCFETFPALIDS